MSLLQEIRFMAKEPLVSVCTPVYNGEPFIADCIQGVLAQRYSNFEYVIVDNASTDRTPEIIQKFSSKDSRIRAFHNPETIFVIDNLMTCVARCSSESIWLKFALADDYLFPNTLDEMVGVGKISQDVGAVSAYRIVGRRWSNYGLPFGQTVFKGSSILKQHLMTNLNVYSGSPNTVLYRKSAFDAVGGFNRRYLHADTALAWRLMDRYDVGFAHCVCTKTNVHGRRESVGSIRSGRRIREFMDFGFRSLPEYRSVSFAPEEIDDIATHYASLVCGFLGRKAALLKVKEIRLMLNSCPDEIRSKVYRTLLTKPQGAIKGSLRELVGVARKRG